MPVPTMVVVTRLRRVIGIGAAVALVASACGTDSAPSATRSADEGTTSPTATDDDGGDDAGDRNPTTTATTADPPETTTIPPLVPTVDTASPAELADRIGAAESTARDPDAPEPAVAAAAFEAQLLYRQLARVPDWDDAVLAAVPGDLGPTVAANIAARREFRAMHNQLSDTLPAWRIVDPAPAEELLSYYRDGEETYGVPWEILAAINLVETGMGRIRGTSVAGAQGPMQFMPATWDAYGEGDVDDPHDAILAAARYLAANGGAEPERLDNALFRYNNSNRYVRGVKHYASIMTEDAAAFAGFYHWQVIYLSELGDIWLPTGYDHDERLAAANYVVNNPGHHLGTDTR